MSLKHLSSGCLIAFFLVMVKQEMTWWLSSSTTGLLLMTMVLLPSFGMLSVSSRSQATPLSSALGHCPLWQRSSLYSHMLMLTLLPSTVENLLKAKINGSMVLHVMRVARLSLLLLFAKLNLPPKKVSHQLPD